MNDAKVWWPTTTRRCPACLGREDRTDACRKCKGVGLVPKGEKSCR